MDIFDLIPDNFFSILSSKNKRLYVACLIETFRIYENGSILGTDKKMLADELAHFLEHHESYRYDSSEDEKIDEIDEDIEEAKNSKRSLAYYVLRKFEECGWIYIDVDNDYQEILNFTDAGITIMEALMQINPNYENSSYNNDFYDDNDYQPYRYHQSDYNGYIYTIYCLLTNPIIEDYAVVCQEVYRNTRLLIRSLRKLDSRMKDYISQVVETTEIKDLITKLIDYKSELIDGSYLKLKTGDNINKYRLPIVSKLEEFEQNDNIMYVISNSYKGHFQSADDAYKKAYRVLDEMIDIFNSLDEFISEIDFKNKKYIDSTIGKIKFLLTEDDNITGKINTILRYIKLQNKHGHIDSAIQTCQSLFTLRQVKTYNQESSLYTPRGKYSRNLNQSLDLSEFEFTDDAQTFLKEYSLPYSEESIARFVKSRQYDGQIRASHIVKFSTDIDEVMMLIYTLMYACEVGLEITKCDNVIVHYKFTFNDFIIKVGDF